METAVVVALISAVASATATAATAIFSRRTQLSVTELEARREHEARDEERRSQARVVLDQYRGPLLGIDAITTDEFALLALSMDALLYPRLLEDPRLGSRSERDDPVAYVQDRYRPWPRDRPGRRNSSVDLD